MQTLKPGKYRHYKGKEYEVLGVGKHSETLENVVVYRDLYFDEEFGDNALWVRPLEMFLEKGDFLGNGKVVPRFEYIGE